MRILLFSYWSIHEGISKGTLFPLLEAMSRDRGIEKIVLCTVESDVLTTQHLPYENAEHIPIKTNGLTSFNKFWNLARIPFLIRRSVKAHAIDLVWCKGAPAGGVGWLNYELSGTPFVVDSYEPHSHYMVDSGTWSRTSLKFLMQNWLESMTRKHACVLLPVSHQYHQALLNNGVKNERLFLVPCVVNVRQFVFQEILRKEIRELLRIDNDAIAGIYVGKYGGLYYDDEAFELYARLFRYFSSKFFLILITEADRDLVFSKLDKYKLPRDRVFVSRVEHSRIPDYLSAADFAISTIKSVPAMRFCSPIKHGEYWAADLPILTTLKVGDDAEIIRNEGGGVIIDALDENPKSIMDELNSCLSTRSSGRYAKLASKYRHPRMMQTAIEFVLKKSVTMSKPVD